MIRSILSVIVGYFVMGLLIFVLFTALYLALGADNSFMPESYEPSILWSVSSVILGTLAAIIGGCLCSKISKLPKPPMVLAVVVIVLGVLTAIPELMADAAPQEKRTGDVSNMDAMMKAKPPVWSLLMNPVIGAVGVLIGARIERSRSANKPQ